MNLKAYSFFLIATASLLVLIFFVAIYFFASEYIYLASLFFSVPLSIGMSLIAEYFRGIGRTVLSQVLNQFLLFSLIITGILYIYLSNSVYLESFIILYLISHLLAFLYSTYLFRINIKQGKLSFHHFTSAITESSTYSFMKITSTFILILDIIIITTVFDASEYSDYIFGQRIGQLPSIFLTILAIHSMPKLVSLKNNISSKFLTEYQRS